MATSPSVPNVGSQLDRAIVAWLISQGVGTDPVCSVLPANSTSDNPYPNITVYATRSQNEPALAGNKTFTVQVRIASQASTAVNDENPENARVILDLLTGQCAYQLLQSNDGQSLNLTAMNITAAGRSLAASADPIVAANNADMANFTCQYLFDQGQTRGKPSEEGAAWIEVLNFSAVANPSAVDMT